GTGAACSPLDAEMFSELFHVGSRYQVVLSVKQACGVLLPQPRRFGRSETVTFFVAIQAPYADMVPGPGCWLSRAQDRIEQDRGLGDGARCCAEKSGDLSDRTVALVGVGVGGKLRQPVEARPIQGRLVDTGLAGPREYGHERVRSGEERLPVDVLL